MECRQSIILSLGFKFVILTAFVCSTQARPPRTFRAGGRYGWTLLPDDGLNRWAAKRRFRVNDTILFEYDEGKDSVLVVRKRAYYHCNKTSPIHNMTDGHSSLKFTRNGPFFFISGSAHNCVNGQKLRLVVMSPNHPSPPPPSLPPAPSPDVTAPPPAPSPDVTAPPPASAPAPSPWSPSPSPSVTEAPSPDAVTSPSPAPDVTAPPPASTPSRPPPPGDGWITAVTPQKNSSPSSAVTSWGLTMAAAFLIYCLV